MSGEPPEHNRDQQTSSASNSVRRYVPIAPTDHHPRVDPQLVYIPVVVSSVGGPQVTSNSMEQSKAGANGVAPHKKKKERGSPTGKNVVVLKPCDVVERDGTVFMPNTIEMAKLKKAEKGQFKTNVQISSRMTDKDIKRIIVETFPFLEYQRFYCAAAVDERTRLDFHGVRRIWDGRLVKQKIKGNSVLYIFAEENPTVAGQLSEHFPEQIDGTDNQSQMTVSSQSVIPSVNHKSCSNTGPLPGSMRKGAATATAPLVHDVTASSLPTETRTARDTTPMSSAHDPQNPKRSDHQPSKKRRTTTGFLKHKNNLKSPAARINPYARPPQLSQRTPGSKKDNSVHQIKRPLPILPDTTLFAQNNMNNISTSPDQISLGSPCLTADATTSLLSVQMNNLGITNATPLQPETSHVQKFTELQRVHDVENSHGVSHDRPAPTSPQSNSMVRSIDLPKQTTDVSRQGTEESVYTNLTDLTGKQLEPELVGASASNHEVASLMCTTPNSISGTCADSLEPLMHTEPDVTLLYQLLQGNQLPPEMENEGPLRISHMSEKSARLESQQGQVPDWLGNISDPSSSGIGSSSGPTSSGISNSSDHASTETSDFDADLNFSEQSSAMDQLIPMANIQRKVSMFPREVDLSGGYFCRFEFTPELLPELDSGHAAVGNLGTINLNKEGKHLVGYYIPPSDEPGLQPVTIFSHSGELLGKTELNYRKKPEPEFKEILERVAKEVNQDPTKMGLVLSLLANCCGGHGTNSSGETQNYGCFGSTETVQVLLTLLYKAAECGAQLFIKMILNSSAGRVIFREYKDSVPLPEVIARNHGHENTALYLEEINARFSEDPTPKDPKRVLDWPEFLAAINSPQDESSDATEDESRQPDVRNDSDSSYLGDVESLSCDSAEPSPDSEGDLSDMFSKGNEKETHDWPNTVLKESIFSDRTFQVRYRPVTALSGGLISLKEINSRGKRNKNQPILRENDAFQINEHDLHHWMYLLSIPTEDIPRHLSTMHERLITQIQFIQYPAEKTQRWLSVTLQRMLLDPTEGGTTRLTQSAVAVESNSDQDMESLYADDDISIQNVDATLRRLLNHPVNLCHSTVFEIWMLACLYGPSRKTLFVYVANRKDVFPPETWFMDEDCQLWIESWNWQRCKNISLTKKVKRSQEQSGASTCIQWKGITWWDKEFDAFLRYKIDPNSQKQFKLRNRAVNQQRKLQDDPEVKLSRTKAHSQREIGTSSKTENFVNRLGKGEAYNNLAAAHHSPKDCVTATDDFKRNRKTAEELGDIWSEGTVYGNLGTAHDYLGDLKAVVVYQERHLKNVQVVGDMSGEGTAYGNLGNVYNCLEYFKRAKDYCERHQDQIKEWCGAIFAKLIAVLPFVVLCSVLFCYVLFVYALGVNFCFIVLCLSLVLSNIFLRKSSARLKARLEKAADETSRNFFTRKRKGKRIHPYKLLN